MSDKMSELLFEPTPSIQVPKRGQESAWNYPRPPRLEPVHQKIKVEFGGLVLAETTQGYRLLETASPPVYYFPAVDVRIAYLMLSSKQSVCKWRGVARYWDLRVERSVALYAAWSYPDSKEGYEVLCDYLAFFPGKVDACYLGREKVKAQPGGSPAKFLVHLKASLARNFGKPNRTTEPSFRINWICRREEISTFLLMSLKP